MKTLSKARKIGGSLMVRVPREVAKAEGIRDGELVSLRVEKVKRDFFGALKGIGPFTVRDELTSHE